MNMKTHKMFSLTIYYKKVCRGQVSVCVCVIQMFHSQLMKIYFLTKTSFDCLNLVIDPGMFWKDRQLFYNSIIKVDDLDIDKTWGSILLPRIESGQ